MLSQTLHIPDKSEGEGEVEWNSHTPGQPRLHQEDMSISMSMDMDSVSMDDIGMT